MQRRLASCDVVDVRGEVGRMRGVSTGYRLAYRLGFAPWERYGRAAAASIAVLLEREEAGRSRPLGRAP